MQKCLSSVWRTLTYDMLWCYLRCGQSMSSITATLQLQARVV